MLVVTACVFRFRASGCRVCVPLLRVVTGCVSRDGRAASSSWQLGRPHGVLCCGVLCRQVLTLCGAMTWGLVHILLTCDRGVGVCFWTPRLCQQCKKTNLHASVVVVPVCVACALYSAEFGSLLRPLWWW